MEMNIDMNLVRLETKVKLAEDRTDNILAFAEVRLFQSEKTGDEFLLKITGFTIRKKEFDGKEVVDVVFPAFRAGFRYVTVVYLKDKPTWQRLHDLLLADYYDHTGGVPDPLDIPKFDAEEVANDIPF